MNTIKFVASELAIVTGHNKYETAQKVIDSVLNRSGIVKKYIPKAKIEESLLSLSLSFTLSISLAQTSIESQNPQS